MNRIIKEEKMLISIEECPYLNWNPDRGKRLKALLGSVTNQQVSDRVTELGHTCTRQNFEKIINGKARTVNTSLLSDICKLFGVDFAAIIPVRIETESKEISDTP